MLLLAIAACSSPGERGGVIPTDATLANASNGVELQANGAGVIDLSAAGVGNSDFQFVAHRKADGSVNGHFRQSRMTPSGSVDFTGVITCVTIDPTFPGRARIGGVVTENNSTPPGFMTTNHEVGDDVWFRVLDDGNGGSAADRSTTLGFKPTLVNTSAEYCALPFSGLPWWSPASIFPLAEGTVRVND